MRIEVIQVVQGNPDVWNEVNTDLVERVHENGHGGLTLDFSSGKYIDIREDKSWWRQHALQKD